MKKYIEPKMNIILLQQSNQLLGIRRPQFRRSRFRKSEYVTKKSRRNFLLRLFF